MNSRNLKQLFPWLLIRKKTSLQIKHQATVLKIYEDISCNLNTVGRAVIQFQADKTGFTFPASLP